MTRDDIYDHLAKVYLGKKKDADDKQKRNYHVWLLFNVFITIIIFSSIFYGLTAFLTHMKPNLRSQVIYALHQGPVRIHYDFESSLPPTKELLLRVDDVDLSRYKTLKFAIRAKEEGSPGTMKVVFKNKRNETDAYYVKNIGYDWETVIIPFEKFYRITDWSTMSDISFVLESWNVDDQDGLILIDDIFFSS